MKKNLIALAATYFASYPGEKEIHFTTDEQAFFSKNDAINHGNSIRANKSKDAEVITVTKQEVDAAGSTDEKAINAAKAKVEKLEKAVAKNEEALQKASDKLQAKPEDQKLKDGAELVKANLERSKSELEAAKNELAQLTEAE